MSEPAGQEPRGEEIATIPEGGHAEEGPSAAPDDAPPGRRRRGCGCLLRGPLYLLLLLVVVAVGAYLFLQSDAARERAVPMLEARLAEYFGRDVEVGEVSWTLFPLSAELRGVVIPGPEPGDPAFARIPRLTILARIENWADWRSPALEIEQVYAEGPEVYLEVREDGSNNLPRFGRQRETPSRLDVRLQALIVEEGRFRFNELELPLDLVARSILARLEGTGGQGGGELEGRFTAQEIELTPPGGAPYSFTLSSRGRFGPRQIELDAVKVAGPDLTASARGTFLVPEEDRRLELTIAAEGEVALATRLGYLEADPALAAGPFRFAGGFAWRPETWALEGSLESSRLVLAERVLYPVEGLLEVGPDRLHYRITRAGYAGGTLAGTVVADLGSDPLPIELDLTLDGLGLQAILDDQELPIEGVSGSVDGQVSYRFTTDAPDAGSGWADLALRSARSAQLGDTLALTGQVPLEIERGVVSTQAARLVSASGSQVLDASGSYDIAGGRGDFAWEVATRDVGELADLLEVTEDDGSRPAWLPEEGTGDAEGVLRIGPGGVGTRFTFALENVVAPGLAADRVSGSGDVDATGLRDLVIEAAAGGGALMVAGTLPLGDAPGGPPFDLTVDAVDWAMDERLALWLPFEVDPALVSGPISGRLELTGDPDALSGRADLEIEPAVVAGQEVELLRAELRFDPELLVLEDALVRTVAGDLTGQGTLVFDSGALDFTLASTAIDLAAEPLAGILAGDARGQVSLAATIGGTLERPEVRASLESRDLQIAGRGLTGDGDGGGARATALELEWDGEQVRATGGIPGLLELSGGGALSLERADLRFEIATPQLGELIRLFAAEVPRELVGSLAGTVTVAGDFARPEDLVVRIELPDLRLDYEGRTLVAVEPVVARTTGSAIAIESLFLQELTTESELFVAGTIGLSAEMPLDLRTQGSLSTDWVELFAPTIDLDGVFDVLATVRGTVRQPRINGQGELRGGHLIVEGFPQSLDDLSAVVLFYPERVVLDRLDAEIGGGSLRAFGTAQLYGPQGLEYRLQAAVEDVTVRYPEGFWFRGDGALTLQSTAYGRVIRGTVDLDRAYYVEDVEVGLLQLMRRALRAERLEVAQTDELSAATQLAISVRAPGTVRVRNNLADLRGSADLAVRGTLARPILFGTVEIDPGGDLVYAENEFTIERARLTFASPSRIDPIVDLVATTEVREYLITLNLAGKLDELQAQVASDPPLSDLDVVSLLTTGRPPDDRGVIPGAAQVDAFTAERFLAGQAASVVSERVGTLFGLDKFRISPVGSDTGDSIAGVGVTVGKRLSKDVFVTYTEAPSAPEGSFLQIEWQVDEQLTLVLTANGDNTYRLDARWDKRF